MTFSSQYRKIWLIPSFGLASELLGFSSDFSVLEANFALLSTPSAFKSELSSPLVFVDFEFSSPAGTVGPKLEEVEPEYSAMHHPLLMNLEALYQICTVIRLNYIWKKDPPNNIT